MELSEIQSKVRQIEIKAKGLSKHIFSGEYQSAFKGRGMSFSEVRDYQYGDDVRNIDWNVTDRTGEPHVKVFEEERELTVMLLIDVSRSVYFGSGQKFKNEIIAEISGVLAFSAMNNNDKVGVIFFSDRIEKFIPPKKGKKHILRIILEIFNFKPVGKGTDVGAVLKHLNNIIKKRCICFVLSDFDVEEGYELPLSLAAKRHDVIGVHLYDYAEENIPVSGLYHFQDLETGEIVLSDAGKDREAYKDRFNEKLEQFESSFLHSGADTVSISANEKDAYVDAFLKLFKKRAK